ncbi:MAG: hydrogenase maturation protease [Desulfobaccales bacterium]
MAFPQNFQLRIIGVGQEWRSDDAAGLLVARLLKPIRACRGGPVAPAPGGRATATDAAFFEPDRSQVAVLETSGSISDLLAAWDGAGAAILADAVRGGGPPGKIYRFPVHEAALPAELFPAASTHAWGIAQAVALGQALRQLPPFLVVYGIEAQDFGIGQRLSAAVAKAIPAAARLIWREVQEVLGQGSNDHGAGFEKHGLDKIFPPPCRGEGI